MEPRGLDAIVVVDPSNMSWLTGYDGWSFYVHQAVLLTMEGEPLWWAAAWTRRARAAPCSWITSASAATTTCSCRTPEAHPMADLAAILDEHGLERARIGVELDNYYYTAAAHATLSAALPGAKLVDATGLVNWRRAVKSPREIRVHPARRAHRGGDARAHPGDGRAGDAQEPPRGRGSPRTGIEGADGHWGDYPAIVPMAPSGLDATRAAPDLGRPADA